jgi:hypothetical protein
VPSFVPELKSDQRPHTIHGVMIAGVKHADRALDDIGIEDCLYLDPAGAQLVTDQGPQVAS